MKIIPMNGYAVVQRVKQDYEFRGKLVIPQSEKNSTFFNRAKIVAVEAPWWKFWKRTYRPDDVVIVTQTGFQLGVPGKVKNAEEQWLDVMIVPADQIIAKLSGDFAEEVIQSSILTSEIDRGRGSLNVKG